MKNIYLGFIKVYFANAITLDGRNYSNIDKFSNTYNNGIISFPKTRKTSM